MAEPKTSEELAAEKALVAKQAELDKANEALEKEKGRVAGAEKKFNDWANELGEIRKQGETLKETLAEAQKTIAELKAIPKTDAEKAKELERETDFDTIEKSLSDEQRKTGEERFNVLSQAEKLQYESDPKFKLAFLKRLQEVAPIVPISPWKTVAKKKANDGQEYDEILDRVFDKKKRSSFVPPGSSGGVTFMTKGQQEVAEPPEDTRVK